MVSYSARCLYSVQNCDALTLQMLEAQASELESLEFVKGLFEASCLWCLTRPCEEKKTPRLLIFVLACFAGF
jgi:hypothetical protein